MEDQQYSQSNKSIKGYQVVILILTVILGALTYVYFRQTNSLKAEFAVERDTLTSNIERLVSDMDNITTTNVEITQSLETERGKADSLLQRLQSERNLSASKIRRYEKELGTLRTVMRGFVQQIDSLNTLNNKLLKDNVSLRDQVSRESLRAEMASEKADELAVKVRKGSRVTARGINLLALNSSDKEVSRASRAARLRIDFVLSANDLAETGPRNVYAVIRSGEGGYILANAGGSVFMYENETLVYSAVREVDYQGNDLSVSLYYTGGGITEGKYKVSVYMDGLLIGQNEIMLK